MLIDIQQGTQEWHEVRKTKIGASDAPVIMGVSPWKTPLGLWEEKLGLKNEPETTYSMKRGIDNEEKARKYFEDLLGKQFTPKVFVSQEYEWMIASLDGITEDGSQILELKCAGSDDHMKAALGEVPEKYYPQLQHQMFVTGVSSCIYGSFDVDTLTGHYVEVKRDDNYIELLLEKEKQFKECLDTFTCPDSSLKDYAIRNDDNWAILAERWKKLNTELERLEKEEEVLRNALIHISGGNSSMGSGIKLTKYEKKGTVDYKKVPELENVNLDLYRKPGSYHWRLQSSEVPKRKLNE